MKKGNTKPKIGQINLDSINLNRVRTVAMELMLNASTTNLRDIDFTAYCWTKAAVEVYEEVMKKEE